MLGVMGKDALGQSTGSSQRVCEAHPREHVGSAAVDHSDWRCPQHDLV